jgi:hypothetical protein
VFKYILAVVLVIGLIAAWLAFGAVRRTLFARRAERAIRQFARSREQCQAGFLEAAGASGKPRGLIWKQATLSDQLLLARDRANGELVGLVGVTVSFDAVAGGAMEEVEAVGNLRAATAIFTHNGRDWTTQGRTLFNLEPREVLERYRDSLDPVA